MAHDPGTASERPPAPTPTPAPVREPAWPVARSAIGLWALEGAISSALWAVTVTVGLLVLPPAPGGAAPVLVRLLPAAVAVYAVVAIGVRPFVRYRVHRWEVTAEAVHALTGWLTRTWTLVPISRIQTVDVTRGALQQAFGLATVSVLTASSQGTVRVPHLEADVAQRVAEDLARRAESVRDEAT